MKKSLILIAVLLWSGLKAQDVHFTQFNFAPLQVNPGNAGSEYDIRLTMNYRNQWSSVASPYSTIGGAYDMRLKKIGEGVLCGGMYFYNDKAGNSKMGTTQGDLALAYHLTISRGQTLGLGVMGGYGQKSINTSSLTWGNQFDGANYNGALPTGEPVSGALTKGFVDLGAGMVYTFKQNERYITGNDQKGASVGFAVMHVQQPDVSFYGGHKEPLYRRYVFHGNGLIGVGNSRISLAPGFMFAMQGKAKELLIGTNVRYRLQEDSHYTGFVSGASLSLGAWYRNNDAMCMNFLFQFSGYSIGMAYDINLSDLAQASNGKGGFEIAIRYVYPNSGATKSSSTRFL